jgi:hypothetical protein
MTNLGKNPGRTTRWLCRLARLWGTLVVAFWLFVGVLAQIGGAEPWTIESSVLAGLVVASAIGVAAGWWRPALGGAILVAVAVAQAVFAYLASGHSRAFAMLISGGPFLLAGALFLLCWHYSRPDRAPGT